MAIQAVSHYPSSSNETWKLSFNDHIYGKNYIFCTYIKTEILDKAEFQHLKMPKTNLFAACCSYMQILAYYCTYRHAIHSCINAFQFMKCWN